MSVSAKIRTYARLRPFSEEELQSGLGMHPAVMYQDDSTLVFNPSELKAVAPSTLYSTTRGRRMYDQNYIFDGVFGPNCSEDHVFETVALPLLDAAMEGRNASMFAYGATGCGKSHTINAIQERISSELMNRMSQTDERTVLKLTYLQLYNEKIADLLPQPNSRAQCLEIRDLTGGGNVSVAGLSEYYPQSRDDIIELLAIGNTNRVIATTKANSNSSRSHAVLTFHIEKMDDFDKIIKQSTFSIIDLAGSERAQATDNRGKRLLEGANINKSLLALGNCITARALKRRFIPYRESKLTRLLRFSLEGNCETAMIVCVSPSLKHFDETKNSLEYGKRAATITHSLQRNTTNRRKHLQTALDDLQARFTSWKSGAMEELVARFPALRTHLESYRMKEDISGKEFTDLVISCVEEMMKRERPAQMDFETPPSRDVMGRRSTRQDPDSRSPLKRTRRNVSTTSPQETPVGSPKIIRFRV